MAERKVAFGTASAPVSRQPTPVMRASPVMHDPEEDPSPPSSGRTVGDHTDVQYHHYAPGHGLTPTSGLLDVPTTRNLGSASAPTSPGLSEQSNPMNQPGSSSLPVTLGNPQQQYHPDPAVRAGLISPSATEAIMPEPESLARANTIEGDGTTKGMTAAHQRVHRHRHRSGASPPSRHNVAFDPYLYAGRPWDRPLGHQNSRHSKPVFSLARPLPTKEQRDAQKSYREAIRTRAAGTPGVVHHQHHQQGPGAHGHPAAPTVGPGAHHALSPYSPYYVPPTHYPHQRQQAGINGVQDKAQLMQLLRELLNEGNDDASKGGKKSGKDKDIMEDKALARKEGFGDNDNDDMEKRKRTTAKAERRDSVGSSTSSTSSFSSNDSGEDEEVFPNPWARFRHACREPFAEFWGTYLLILFGTGVSLQYFLSLDPNVASSPRGSYLSVSFGWGVGVAMGVWVAGGISGGHINPAVTLSLAVFRGFPIKKVPGYVLAQILGSMSAAGTTYGLYRGAINIFEGGAGVRTISGATATASLFSTYPLEYVSDATCFFQEFVDTAVLLMVVLAISDSNNAAPPDGLNPLVLFLVILGLGACLGMQTAYCLNPARDLGPRLVTWMTGYGTDVWNFRNQYWLWTPVIATCSGALFGSFLYDAFIYTGSESPLNRKWEFPWSNKRRRAFAPASKEKMPAGQTEA